jgi:hypothetical protein
MDNPYLVLIILGCAIAAALAAAVPRPNTQRPGLADRRTTGTRPGGHIASLGQDPADGRERHADEPTSEHEQGRVSVSGLSIELAQEGDGNGWLWTLSSRNEPLASGAVASGHEGIAAARLALDELLESGFETDNCRLARRNSHLVGPLSGARAAI